MNNSLLDIIFNDLYGIDKTSIDGVKSLGDVYQAKIVIPGVKKNKISISQKNTTKINILLSPACSSLDMFENYRHRGEEFKKLVSNDYHGENLVS